MSESAANFALYQAASAPQLGGGDATNFRVRISDVHLTDGSGIALPQSGVTAIVGGNNVGKSTILRQIVENFHRTPEQPPIGGIRLARGITVAKTGQSADMTAWLVKYAYFINQPNQIGFMRYGGPQIVDPQYLAGLWSLDFSGGLTPYLAPYFIFVADAAQRLGYIGAVGQRGSFTEPPQHPLHVLQDNPALLQELSDLSEKIFRQPLTLDRLSGNLQLRVGRLEVPAPPIDAVTEEYRQALAKLPLLAEQGDGMRSLLGLLIPIVTTQYHVMVVDEPEAFLHPPQARALGEVLGELAQKKDLQVICATHDRNFLTGLLESKSDVSVVRLDRTATGTHAFQLPAESLRDVWADPVLRHSNVLDGLFYRRVVIAEAERDCRFYSAALEAANERHPTTLAPSEVLFVPSGGKDGMAKIISALRAAAVTTVASPDLDVLNDEGTLRRIVEATGASWDDLVGDYRRATEQFRAPRTPATARHIRDAVDAVLRDRLDEPYSKDLQSALTASLRVTESPWRALKEYGTAAFRAEKEAALRLVRALEAIGIVVVSVGELENFASTVSARKGPEWLPAVLRAGEHDNELSRKHVRRLLGEAVDEPGRLT